MSDHFRVDSNQYSLSHIKSLLKTHPILPLLFIGTVIRLFLFDFVAVNADVGLYLYDARLLAEGATPIVDYPSRSPLFIGLLSLIISSGLDPIVATRSLMVINALAGGLGVYYLTKVVSTQQSAEFAAAVYMFIPLSLFWGLWLKTETVVVVGFTYALARFAGQLDDPVIPAREFVLFGAALGAGFLIRRTLIFYIIAIGLYVVCYRLTRRGRPLITETTGFGLLVTAAITTIFWGYMMIARGGQTATGTLMNEHLFNVIPLPISAVTTFNSFGLLLGSLVGVALLWHIYQRDVRPDWVVPQKYRYVVFYLTASVGLLILSLLLSTEGFTSCLLCTDRQSEAVAEIAYVALPIVVLLLLFLGKFGSDRMKNTALRAGMYLVLLWIVYWFIGTFINQSLSVHGYDNAELLRILLVGVFWLGGMLFVQIPSPKWTDRWTGSHSLLLLLPIVIALVYLLRDRTLFVSYAQELLPFVAVFVGIGLGMIRKQSTKFLFYGVILVLVLAVLIGSLAAPVIIANFGGIVQPHNPEQGTVTGIQAAGESLEEQTQDGDLVFTAQPIYAVQADRDNAAHFSRDFWDYKYRSGANSAAVTEKLVASLESQDVKAVIVEDRTRTVFETAPSIEQAFEENYCYVPDERIENVNAELYLPDQECPS